MAKLARSLVLLLGISICAAALAKILFSPRSIVPQLRVAPLLNASESLDRRMPVQDLSAYNIEVDTLTSIDVRPFHASFWMAKATLLNKQVMFSLYPDADDGSTALLFCPAAGTYNLTINVPVPMDRSGSHDTEPSHCTFYREAGPQVEALKQGWSRLVDSGSVALNAMLRICTVDVNNPAQYQGNIKLLFGGEPEPVVYGLEESLVYHTTFTCYESIKPMDDKRVEVLKLVSAVYGTASSLFMNRGVDSLGFWTKTAFPGRKKGDPFYVPQSKHCPLTFTEHMFNNFQGNCPDRKGLPYFHWTPFTQFRQDWIPAVDAVSECRAKGRPLRLIGDSMMLQAWRAIDCVARGYAGMSDDIFESSQPYAFFYDMVPIFAPREVDVELNEKEVDHLLNFEALPTTAGIEIVFHGMWLAGNVPSTEFARGMHRWFSALQRRAYTHGIDIFLVLLPYPHFEPSFASYVGWQTADRIAKWNKNVLEIASVYEINVIDTFWPTALRHDARVDNSHICDAVSVEVALIILKAICQ